MAEPHQHPYSLQPPPPQQHQSMAPWYGMPPHMYQAQQAPAPAPQHHAVPWTAAAMPPPPGEQAYNYISQPYHAPPQGDYYPRPQQVHHHYPPPPHPAQPQFTYMYGQQDQVWHQANNSWGYQQWPHPAQTASLSQEEVWAAKARAWAASKAVPDESRPTPNAPQIHQDCMFQPQEQGGQPHPLQPPGQEAASVHSYPNNSINQGQLRGQSEHPPQSLGYGQPTQDATPAIRPESVLESVEQKAAQAGGQPHLSDNQPMFGSSQVHDAAASYGLDPSMTGSHGSDPQSLAKKPPAAPVFSQQATHMLPQSQASPLISQPQLPYSDKLATAGYEQLPSNYLQPPPPPPLLNPQQTPAPVPHPPQKQPLQTHYQASSALEGVEGDFGLSPGALQNWALVGGPGMPFPPAMGAGTSQFDPIHTPHQLPVAWRPDGSGLQGLGFSNSAPFGSPGLGPGAGPPVRPLFAPDTFVERPKKAAVPSWLREELMKKKAAGLTGNASGMLSSDESTRLNGEDAANPVVQRVGISDKLRSSTPGLSEDEEEDQEEEIEAARSAAINQEIKRLLTEVLLKVTGDLFKEIAQEVLDEDSDDITQGISSPDERSRVERLASPLSPEEGPPPPSGRVFVSSGKNATMEDSIRDKESSDSGEAAGDVLGLGNYASDDETLDPQDKKEAPHRSNTEAEKANPVTNNSADQATYEESGDAHKGKIAEGPLQSSKEHLHKMNGINEEDIVRETSGKQDTTGQNADVQNGRSPAGRDLGASSTQVLTSTYKENTGPTQFASEQSSSKEKSISMSRGEGKSQDTLTRSLPGTEPAGHSSADASVKKLDNKETSFSQGTLFKDRKREERREDRPKDLSSKERKREDKPAIESKRREERDDRAKVKSDTSRKERHGEERMKDGEEMKRLRGSESRVRDSSRERRKEKEKVKEKSKPRERESDRDRKKQDKREREGHSSKRTDGVEKKARHRSASSSSRERSSSSNSDRSRGRLDARRSSRHHTSTSSPGRSRKRRASRSRSRSRSPHVKHTHRRNVPSPSHEKTRRSGSKSPLHRRGRG